MATDSIAQQQEQQSPQATMAVPSSQNDSLRRRRQLIRRQQRIMESSIKLINQGVKLHAEGRDRRAIDSLTAALTAARRSVYQQQSVPPSSPGLPESVFPSTPQTDAASPGILQVLLTPADGRRRSQQADDDNVYVASDDGQDEPIVFDDVHATVPIHKKVQLDTERQSGASHEQPLFVCNNAFLLSNAALRKAKTYHRHVRQIEYECDCFLPNHDGCSNEPNESSLPLEDNEALRLAIDTDFLELMMPIVSAAIVYNMALLFDVQSRCMLATVEQQRCHRTDKLSSVEAAAHRRHGLHKSAYFASKAYMLYGSVLRLLKKQQWQTCGTAIILRIAAINNRTVLRSEDRIDHIHTAVLGSDDADQLVSHRIVQSNGHALLSMVRYLDSNFVAPRIFPPSAASSSSISSSAGLTRCDLDGILLNTCLWLMDACSNPILQSIAPAA